MKATLTLEGGSVFEGTCYGGTAGRTCDIVFDTSMTGVTELITDPVSAGQALVLTCPLIGNCGVAFEDFQSEKPQISALIVSELSEMESNFRCEDSLQAVLERYNIPVIAGVDTRSLVRLLRAPDAPARVSVSIGDTPPLPWEAPRYQGERKLYTPAEGAGSVTVAVPDTGLRRDMVEHLLRRGINVSVFPYGDAIPSDAQAFLLPGGPGDPTGYDLAPVKAILQTGKPIFAVGLGHQLLALANGATTVPLRPGHRGANIPVRDCSTGKVTITAQSHGFTVDRDSVDADAVSHVNVNDGTVEGLRWRDNVFSVQFTPDKTIWDAFSRLL